MSVSVAVHWVVAPYRTGLGLQATETDTESFEAAWPYGTIKLAKIRTATPMRIRLALAACLDSR